MRFRAASLLLASSLMTLGACGLRGPLYLPDERPETEAQAAQPAATDSARSVDPQPAPQAQKRDRTSQPAESPPAEPAN